MLEFLLFRDQIIYIEAREYGELNHDENHYISV